MLRAATDKCIHYAMVSDVVCHVPAKVYGTQSLGLHYARGVRDTAENSPYNLGEIIEVTMENYKTLAVLCFQCTYLIGTTQSE